MRYSIQKNNDLGTVLYFPQKWVWSFNPRKLGWQYVRTSGGTLVKFETLDEAKEFLEGEHNLDVLRRKHEAKRIREHITWHPESSYTSEPGP